MAVSAYNAELFIRTLLHFITSCVMSGCGLYAVGSPPFMVFARQTVLVCYGISPPLVVQQHVTLVNIVK